MPVAIDVPKRRRDLSEAVWRIALTSGLASASVRRIAEEADLSTGSVRHYFPTQAALHAFAMELIAERIGARIAALDLPADPVAAAETALAQLLPLDEERRAENRVWLAFTVAAQTDPALGKIMRRTYGDLRFAAAHWVGELLPDVGARVTERETERLFALVDGLAVHAAIAPDALSADTIRDVLHGHLLALQGSAI